MSWLAWIGIAVVVAGIAAVTGMKPKGSRHVAGTRMMGVARVVLVLIAIVFAVIAFQARG